MDQEVMPKTTEELKRFILDTLKESDRNIDDREIDEDGILYVSDKEQKEIEELYGEGLNGPRNPKDYEPL